MPGRSLLFMSYGMGFKTVLVYPRCTNAWMMLSTLLGLVSLSLVSGVDGQIVAPTCNASLGFQAWAYNSLGQSPCEIASILGQACDTQYTIPAITTNEHYSGPSTGPQASNQCLCSSVMYILLSACGACQGGTFITWSAYDNNCTGIYPTIFPVNIPSGTRIPHYAFQNVTAEDDFNPTEAESEAGSPESTGTSPPTGSISSTSSATTSPTVTSSTSSQTKKTNSGAIAGGVVGGVIVLLLAVAALLFFRRRQRRLHRDRAVIIDPVDDKPRPFNTGGPVSMSTLPDTIDSTGTGFHASIPTPMSMPSAAMRLYNPSDPSTFPPTALSTSPSPPPRAHHSPQSSETSATGYLSSAYHTITSNRQPGLPEV
ncbi:hypothetical protein FB446DRAFT_407780 [Lentinula raphanica]|nr:hypothetical protein FB446DRAFT_407780 [Lentinula raphanica]